jgi:serpin B
MRVLDFVTNPEASRLTVNSWMSDQTDGRVQNLIPEGAINGSTRLVLTNAVYFNAAWAKERRFDKADTQNGPFHLLNGADVTVPMMRQKAYLRYGERDNCQWIDMPYDGGELSMIVILPGPGDFENVESALNAQTLAAITAPLPSKHVYLILPKFTLRSQFSLGQTLAGLGMPDAFDPAAADFAGMTGNRELFISDVVHKAFVSVNEDGTEAAAATAIETPIFGSGTVSEPAYIFLQVDRPFLFVIRDIATRTIVFVGRVLNPAA